MAALLRLLFFILLYIVSSEFGGCVHVILGDPATFPETANCKSDEPAEVYRVLQHGTQLVAARGQGVWKPTEGYKDRVNQNTSFAFSRTVYSDTGLYQFICGSSEKNMNLDVLVAFEASVTEGDPVNLPCYFITTDKPVESVQRRKEGEMVLDLNLSTRKTKYGTGFEGKVSLSPDGFKHGDWSLMWDQAQLQDEGDYFCSVNSKDAREAWGDPAAVRLKVTEGDPVQTSLRPPLTPRQSVTEEKMGTGAIVAITAVVVVTLFLVIGYLLKSCCCKGGRPYLHVDKEQANGGPHQANGGTPPSQRGPSSSHDLNSSEVESMV